VFADWHDSSMRHQWKKEKSPGWGLGFPSWGIHSSVTIEEGLGVVVGGGLGGGRDTVVGNID